MACCPGFAWRGFLIPHGARRLCAADVNSLNAGPLMRSAEDLFGQQTQLTRAVGKRPMRVAAGALRAIVPTGRAEIGALLSTNFARAQY